MRQGFRRVTQASSRFSISRATPPHHQPLPSPTPIALLTAAVFLRSYICFGRLFQPCAHIFFPPPLLGLPARRSGSIFAVRSSYSLRANEIPSASHCAAAADPRCHPRHGRRLRQFVFFLERHFQKLCHNITLTPPLYVFVSSWPVVFALRCQSWQKYSHSVLK